LLYGCKFRSVLSCLLESVSLVYLLHLHITDHAMYLLSAALFGLHGLWTASADFY